MTKRRRLLNMFLFGVALATAAEWIVAPARAESVAMITDLSGRVSAPGAKTGITILSEIEAGTQVQLDPGARLVAIYLRSGDEYTVTGPATVNFSSAEVLAVRGATPVKRSNPLAQGGAAIRIKPVGVIQAAMVMRSMRPSARVRLLNLSGTYTLDAQPEFRWRELQPGLKYHFEISDDTGRNLHEAQVDTTSYRLPANVQLREGVPYTWGVSVRLADGRKYTSAGDFSIAPAAIRARAEALRPAASAPLSMRVTYAAWLAQVDLKDEARKYWQAASSERPDDPRLRELAEQ